MPSKLGYIKTPTRANVESDEASDDASDDDNLLTIEDDVGGNILNMDDDSYSSASIQNAQRRRSPRTPQHNAFAPHEYEEYWPRGPGWWRYA